MNRISGGVLGAAGPPSAAAETFARGRSVRMALATPMLLVLPALGLALFSIIHWRFDGLYGQDSYAYYDYATGPLRATILHGMPVAAFFWPLGYPAPVAVLSLLMGATPAAAQTVGVAAGVACVWLTYVFGRDVLTVAGAGSVLARRAAAIAALLFGVMGWTVQASIADMPDSVALAAALLSAWGLVRWSGRTQYSMGGSGETVSDSSRILTPERIWLFVVGVGLAWSVITRWGQLALVPVWLAAGLMPRPARTLRALPWAALPALAIVGAQLWLVYTVPPGPGLGRWPFLGDIGLVNGGGWAPIHLFQRSFFTADGTLHYSLPNGLFYGTAVFRLAYLTPLAAPAVLLGAWLVATRYRRAAILLIGWPAVVLLLDAGLAEQNIRFVLAAVPPVAILAGLGIAGAWEALPLRSREIGAVLLAGGIAAVGLAGMRETHWFVAATQNDRAVASWAAERIPPGATTVAFGITATLAHSTTLRPLELSVLTTGNLRHLAAKHRMYVLVDVGTVDGRVARTSPGINYRYLRDSFGLRALGERGGYTLYRVGPG